jgi:hypothetical protein
MAGAIIKLGYLGQRAGATTDWLISKLTNSKEVEVSAVGSRDAADAQEGLVPRNPSQLVLAEAKERTVQ